MKMKPKPTNAQVLSNKENSAAEVSEEVLPHGAEEVADSEECSSISWILPATSNNSSKKKKPKEKKEKLKIAATTKASEVSAMKDRSGEKREP